MGPVRAKSALAPSSRNRCWRQARPPASSGHTRLAREAQPINSSPRPIVWVPARWFIYSRLEGGGGQCGPGWREVAGEDGVAGEARVGQPPEPRGRACCWGFCCDFSGLKDCWWKQMRFQAHLRGLLQTRDSYTPPTTRTPYLPSKPFEVLFFKTSNTLVSFLSWRLNLFSPSLVTKVILSSIF